MKISGEGTYKIVTKKFGRALPSLSHEQLRKTSEELFPQGEGICRREIEVDEIPLFRAEGLQEAARSLKWGRVLALMVLW